MINLSHLLSKDPAIKKPKAWTASSVKVGSLPLPPSEEEYDSTGKNNCNKWIHGKWCKIHETFQIYDKYMTSIYLVERQAPICPPNDWQQTSIDHVHLSSVVFIVIRIILMNIQDEGDAYCSLSEIRS